MARQILDILSDVSNDDQLKTAAEKIGHQPEQGAQSGAGLEGEIKAQMGGTAMDARAVLHEKALQAAGDQLDARTWDDPRENLTSQATAPAGTQHVAPSDQGRNMRETKTSLPSKTAMRNPVRRAGRLIATKGERASRALARGKNKVITQGGDKLRGAKSTAIKARMMGREGTRAAVSAAKKMAPAAATGAVAGAATGYAMGRQKSAGLAEYYDAISQEGGEKVASESFDAATLADLESQALTGIFMGRCAALGQIKEAAGR